VGGGAGRGGGGAGLTVRMAPTHSSTTFPASRVGLLARGPRDHERHHGPADGQQGQGREHDQGQLPPRGEGHREAPRNVAKKRRKVPTWNSAAHIAAEGAALSQAGRLRVQRVGSEGRPTGAGRSGPGGGDEVVGARLKVRWRGSKAARVQGRRGWGAHTDTPSPPWPPEW